MTPVTYIKRGGDVGHFLEVTLKRAIPDILRERKPNDGVDRYFIILPVLDYSRLASNEDNGRLAFLQPNDIEDLRSGRALLILDLSNEGPSFLQHIFDKLHANLAQLDIPRTRVIFVSQNRLLHFDYLRTYGQGVNFWQFEYFVLLLAMWIDQKEGSHIFGHNAFDSTDYRPLQNSDSIRFLSQNAAARWHRALLFRWLHLQNMSSTGLISFHGIGQDNTKGHEFDIAAPPSGVAERFGDLLAGIDNWIPREAVRIDAGGWGNDLVVTLDLEAYRKTDLTLISESDFFVSRIDRVTEKSIKAAATGNPFVMIGTPRAVLRLAEFGFCTFDGLIDQSYDLIEDPLDRLDAVFRSISTAWEMCRRDPLRWRISAREQAEANFSYARSGLLNRLRQLIIVPFVDRMQLFSHAGVVSS